ncbi:MAG: TolC family protein [Pseudomonadota bacterium]
MKTFPLLASTLLLSACFMTGGDFQSPKNPQAWTAYESSNIDMVEIQNLRAWWQVFDDATLNELIGITLSESPDRNIAEARIIEARGIRRTQRSFLFPQVGASASQSREDTGFAGTDNFFDARFDASYEIDLFGKNRNNLNAADENLRVLEASYHDTTLTLIAEVARTYIEYRSFQKQVAIAEKNLDIQKQTLELIRTQMEFGEAPQLDVERAENLVNTTQSSIPEFKRLAENSRLSMSALIGRLPEDLIPILDNEAKIPGVDVKPVLMAPTSILNIRPDVRAAIATFNASTSSAKVATAELFPTLTLSGFFGVSESAFSAREVIWNVAIGAAVAILDFGRIEGQIDAARAVEIQAYEQLRKTILEAVTEVETALTDYARINQQRLSLQSAYDNADRALELSQTLYREGEISFIDVLDAQRTVNEADSALVTAEANQAQSLVRLYKSLGVY